MRGGKYEDDIYNQSKYMWVLEWLQLTSNILTNVHKVLVQEPEKYEDFRSWPTMMSML